VIPENMKNTVKNADLIIFFTAEDDKNNSFVAWAGACLMHRTTMRPIVGRVNFNLYYVNDKKNHFYDNYSTTLHEIYHIMGFTKYLYQFYIDPVTFKRKVASDTYFVDEKGPHPHLLRSPLLLAYAKEHFNCNSLKGVPIEDEGTAGSLGSHWEKTIFGNELMVAIRSARRAVSRFTFKLFEDSGWY
jgi:proprotein convertase subtilisin/kexin type 5